MERFRTTLIRLINEARINPQTAGDSLFKGLQQHYKGEELNYFGKHIETFEGIGALNDYKAYMTKGKPQKSLIVSDTLNKVAQSIAQEKGRSGKSDHEIPINICDKIYANGAIAEGRIGELICLKANSSEQIAAYFLIDDGSAGRKRRKMLLDSRYEFIGVGSAYHKIHECISVIILADQIIDPIQKESVIKYEMNREESARQ